MKLPDLRVYRCDKCERHTCLVAATFMLPRPRYCPYTGESTEFEIMGYVGRGESE